MMSVKLYGLLIALLAGAAICASTPGYGATGPGAGGHLQDRFSRMDANGDGRVVLEEFRTAFPNMNENAFVVIDTNGDGAIDQTEWFNFTEGHSQGAKVDRGAPMNNIPGDPLIPPIDSNDLPLMRPPGQ